jgi:hypothetical protein
MKYDISKQTAPKMPRLGKGTECVKILLSQVSKDMHAPLIPMLFPILAAHVSGSEFQYPDLTWKELCGQMANLVAESGGNKGQLSLLVEAICRDFRQHDEAELKKLVEWQKIIKSRGANKEKNVRPTVVLNLKSSATEHVSLPYRALLPTIQSTAPDHTEHASIYLQSTSLYPREHCSVTYGVMLHTNKSNDLVS